MASPIKRRVLGPLDANATVMPSPSVLLSPAQVKAAGITGHGSGNGNGSSRPSTAMGPRPLFPLSPPASSSPFVATATPSAAAKKRPRDEENGREHGREHDRDRVYDPSTAPSPWKKLSKTMTTTTTTTTPDASFSPAPSSSLVFDVTTTVTEPEVAGPPPPPPARVPLTREQSRQKAEILRLRLGLARYKLRTGQVDVPLEQLRVVPPSVARRSTAQDSSAFSRVPLSLPSFKSAASINGVGNVGNGGSEELACEWVRDQQRQQRQQRQQQVQGGVVAAAAAAAAAAQPQLPQMRNYHSRSNSACSSRSCHSVISVSSRGGSGRVAVGEAVMKDVDVDEDDNDDDDARAGQDEGNGDDDEEEEAEPDLPEMLPYHKGLQQLVTPRPSRRPQRGGDADDDEDDGHGHGLTSSVMRGNAVSGLLSLARS